MSGANYELNDDSGPPPAFSDVVDEFNVASDNLNTSARITGDGRVNINISEKDRRLSALIGPVLLYQLREAAEEQEEAPSYEELVKRDEEAPPSLNIVIQVVGSRGDVQPFVALGQVLKRKWHHRVRLATHPIFKSFVEENGLEFFSIGGDPAQLMAYMVKHPGLLPGMDAIKSGDVRERRAVTYEMLKGCWRSCIETIDDSSISNKPFVADVIIANPPSFAHIHCAEKLGIPLHIMFTMPWSSTQVFPHPLANIQSSNAEPGMINFLSYYLVETLIWQGLGGVINKFRKKILNLEYISAGSGPRLLAKARIPHTYCWSPSLIPRPEDWSRHITIAGFYFLPLSSAFVPEQSLSEFLARGPVPIYIGFGSIVVDDPDAMTALIYQAVAKSGQRAIVSKGWGGLGGAQVPQGIYMIGNVPHDWLFPRVSCVVHHGGAGTTAAGIAAGKPTVVVPFFGDQQFWGNMILKAGAGPKPIPNAKLTSDALAAAIMQALQPDTVRCAEQLKDSIARENGCETGAHSFHDQLQTEKLRCPLAPRNTAIWEIKRKKIRVSALAAAVLLQEGIIQPHDLKIFRHYRYLLESGPWDPVTATLTGGFDLVSDFAKGFADFPVEIRRAVKAKQNEMSMAGEPPVSKENVSLPATNPSAANAGSSAQQSGVIPTDKFQSVTAQASPTRADKATEARPLSSASITDRSSLSEQESHLDDVSLPPSPSTAHLQTQALPTQDLLTQNLGRLSTENSDNDSVNTTNRTLKLTGSALKGAGIGFSKGIGRIMFEGLKGPFEMTTHVARGFHNMPKLYGDDTVREHDRITGVGSGLKAAAKGFTLGVYDGVTGVFTLPYIGAKNNGVAGFTTGFFKGVLGAGIKPSAGSFGILGYPFEGIAQQIKKMGRINIKEYVRISRLAQGFDELKQTSPAQQAQIVERWYAHQAELKRARRTWKGKGKGKAKQEDA